MQLQKRVSRRLRRRGRRDDENLEGPPDGREREESFELEEEGREELTGW